jgi:hypothetical protein
MDIANVRACEQSESIMNSSISMAVALLALAAVPCAPAAQTQSQDAPIAHVNLSGASIYGSRMGYAQLVFHPEGTDVVVQIPPVNGATRPLHLYTYVHQGSCGHLGPPMAQATRRVLGYRESSGFWTVRNTVPLDMQTLRASPHALAVRSSPADGNELLYCGDLHLG